VITLDQHRDKLDKETIKCATFHPFEDIWYVVACENGEWYTLVFVNKILNSRAIRNEKAAREWFKQCVEDTNNIKPKKDSK
jgi:hypothetical protein